jgi:hypothetical protein
MKFGLLSRGTKLEAIAQYERGLLFRNRSFEAVREPGECATGPQSPHPTVYDASLVLGLWS